MELRASLLGGSLHAAISVVAWTVFRYVLPDPGMNSLTFLGAFYGGLLAGSIAEITETYNGGILGFFSGVFGGVLSTAAIATIGALDTGLALERTLQVPGFWLILAAWLFAIQLLQQLGPGLVCGPIGGLVAAALKLRAAHSAQRSEGI